MVKLLLLLIIIILKIIMFFHGRIIFLDDLNNPQILIGHDSPILIAKF